MKENVAFMMKDFVLLAVSFYLLKQDLVRVSLSACNSDEPSETLDNTHTLRKTA
jgi:hypothetical protein